MKKEYIQTSEAPAAVGPYSQAIKLGDFLFSSGQIALDPATGTMVGETAKEQAEQVMKNLKAVLKAADMTFDNVVKTTCFLANMADFAEFNSVYESYLPSKPARSCVQAAALPKQALVEVEVIACK